MIESAARGGGKSFEGRMRFPPGRQGKQVPMRIGVYGKGVGSGSSTFAGSRSGNSSANTYGKSIYVDYSRNYNPSRGTRFKGVWDSHGNYADLD